MTPEERIAVSMSVSRERDRMLRLDEITADDIKDAGVHGAMTHGWTVEPRDCYMVQPIYDLRTVPADVPVESVIRMPVSQWIVDFKPRVPPNQFEALIQVFVELTANGLVPVRFAGPKHPR
jgi:hypothetical protein